MYLAVHQKYSYKYFTVATQIPGESPTYLMGPTRTRVFARVLFLLYCDFLLTKWTLWSRKGSEDIYYFVTCFFRRCTPQIHERSRTHGPARIRFATLLSRGVETWTWSGRDREGKKTTGRELARRERECDSERKERDTVRRTRGRRRENGSVLSQACNARGHRSRNISCQADSNGSNGGGDGRVDTGGRLPGQLDTDCPRSASDDPRGSLPGPCKNVAADVARLGSPPLSNPPSSFPFPLSTVTVYRPPFPRVSGKGHIKRNM